MEKNKLGYWVSGAICFVCLLLGMCIAFGADSHERQALAFLLFSVAFGAAAVMIRIMPTDDKSQTRPSSFTTILLSITMLCVAASKMWSAEMVYDVLLWIGLPVVIAAVGVFIYIKRKLKM